MDLPVAETRAGDARAFSDVFVPGANRFEVFRHVFAGLVLFDHAFVLSGVGHALQGSPSRFSLGHLGVACFFIVSGALIAASHEHCRGILDFLRNRALRIFPAYWVCLLVSALLIGPLNAALASETFAPESAFEALRRYFASPSGPVAYVFGNAVLVQAQPGIGDLFAENPEARSVNGSLWSIPWEAACYLFVALLGSLGGLTRRRGWVLGCLVLALANYWIFPKGSIAGLYYTSERIALLPVYFLLGMTFYLFRASVPRATWAGALAFVGLLAGSMIDLGLAAPFLAYAIFFSAARDRSLERRPPTLDLSYGLYIYGFPVQQTLVALGLHRFGVLPILLGSALIVPWLALLSWRIIEAPALALKRRSLTIVGRPSPSTR